MEYGVLIGIPRSGYTLRSAAHGSAVLRPVNGAVGAALRRQNRLGDAISHAALPVIALSFLLMGSQSTAVLLLGAGGGDG